MLGHRAHHNVHPVHTGQRSRNGHPDVDWRWGIDVSNLYVKAHQKAGEATG